MRLRYLSLLCALALGACSEGPPAPTGEPRPALWEIVGADGESEGWLFGTIHALPEKFDWHSPRLDEKLALADMLVVEVADLGEGGKSAQLFEEMAFDSPEGPIAERIDPAMRDEFDALLVKAKVRRSYFDPMESWAAALALAQVAQTANAGNGVDRALIAGFAGREIVELEGARGQLSIFDRLPEKEQRDLLNSVLGETTDYDRQIRELAEGWRRGDLDKLDALTGTGILADKELREALLDGRNRAWAMQIENLLSSDAMPFVAVGAGHLLGPGGLPALLEKDGYTVRRIQ